MNGDGMADLVKYRLPFASTSGTGTKAIVRLSKGSGFSTNTYWDNISSGFSSHWQFQFADLDGNGAADIVKTYVSPSSSTNGTRAVVRLSGVKPANLLHEVADGLSRPTTFTYERLNETSAYTRGTGTSYPTVDIEGPLHVVTAVSADAGTGTRTTSYEYTAARVDLTGRGFLGFETMTATDSISGHTTKTTYSQSYPYIGQVLATEQRRSNNNLIASSTMTLDTLVFGGTRRFPYAHIVTSTQYELDGSSVTEVETETDYDVYGNAKWITVTNEDVTSGGSGETFTTATVNTFVNDETLWHLGRLVCAEVTQTHPDSSVPPAKRVSGFDYHANTGLLIQEVIEPRSGDIPDDSTCVTTAATSENVTLKTTYTYDTYGNRKKAVVVGDGVSSRTTTTDWGERDSSGVVTLNGRFAVTVTNALNHTEAHTFDGRFGVMTKLTGPNNLDTTWAYDGFGRVTLESRADGTTTTTTRGHCVSDCPVGARLAVMTQTTGQPAVRVYTDSLGREIRSETVGFNGDAVFVDTTYDSRGRQKTKTRPYYYHETPVVATITYDDHSRPVSEIQPGPSGSNVSTTTVYDGLTTTLIDALGNQTSRIANARGELIEVLQDVGNTNVSTNASVAYLYDAFGNLIETTDDQGNSVVNTYNIRGHKLTMDDPDMGQWSYTYNALGELTSQTDAKSQTTTMTYDKLGRQLTRKDDDGGTNEELAEWIYDTSFTAGIGKLYQVKRGGNIERTLEYDSLGRLITEIHHVDSDSFTLQTAYDSVGRVLTSTYPESPHHPTGFKVRYAYNVYGYVEKLTNDAGTEVYWEAQSQDADGQLTEVDLGNGLTTKRGYNIHTRTIGSIKTGTASNDSSIQHLTFDFDAMGNLTSRADALQQVDPGTGLQPLTETFTYDALNRVITSSVTNQTQNTYAYDTLGNITSKTDVGSYTYSGVNAGPHAVTTAGSFDYLYDANGNQTEKKSGVTVARDITYTAFNKPEKIDKNGTWVEFTYGADRGRIKQTDSAGNELIYVAGGVRYERRTDSGGDTEHLHYLAAGGEVIGIYQSEGTLSGGGETPVGGETNVFAP